MSRGIIYPYKPYFFSKSDASHVNIVLIVLQYMANCIKRGNKLIKFRTEFIQLAPNWVVLS